MSTKQVRISGPFQNDKQQIQWQKQIVKEEKSDISDDKGVDH